MFNILTNTKLSILKGPFLTALAAQKCSVLLVETLVCSRNATSRL